MPQITVDYSAGLDDAFDRRGFALALHPLIAETVSTEVPNCKTRFRRVEESVVGDAPTGDVIVHIAIAMLAGRSPELKGRLADSVLDLLHGYVKPAGGQDLHVSAETRDLDPSYRKG
ncbi:isomerase [Streptomyces sp. NBC_00654]|uniref:5-carboxymethyl-2-hydroxymuconate Delta-isomerase n=1 Tax=Streptomyces sp. NBC_00654 TaxID=2975799 RepID=UPI00224FCB3F|nr:isomerase [Streptomyces sp. NBC_00654]MCX4968933.1 isomerase [Streptomyces sp. NBC_00654]